MRQNENEETMKRESRRAESGRKTDGLEGNTFRG